MLLNRLDVFVYLKCELKGRTMQKIKIGWTDDVCRKYLECFVDMLRDKYEIEYSDDPDFLFCNVFGRDYLKSRAVRILFTGENYVPDFNVYDYALSFEEMTYLDRNLRVPYYYYFYRQPETQARLAANFSDEQLLNRKFCNFVYSNRLYSNRARKDFFELLSRYKKVDSGGAFLNNIGYRIDDKYAFQKEYKFSIAFENASHYGYTTEKIFDAFVAKTVPIYWGNPDVVKDFNKDAFINCNDYDSLEEVVQKVKELDNDDEAYLKMLKTPFLNDGKVCGGLTDEKIAAFLDNIFSKGKDFYYRMGPRPEEFEGGREVCSCKYHQYVLSKGFNLFIKILCLLVPVRQWRKNLQCFYKIK